MENLIPTLSQSLNYLTPLAGQSTLALLGLGVAVLAFTGFILGILKTLYLKHKQKVILRLQQEAGKIHPTWWQSFKAWGKSFLQRLGYLHDGLLAESFVAANNLLKTLIGGRDYAYKIPRYILIGPEGSGKSTLMSSLDERLMGSILEAPGEAFDPDPLKWRFYDVGSVLEVPGTCLIQKDALDSDQKKWSELLSLAVHFRVKKPLDGIILALSVQELTDLYQLDPTSLARRGQYMRQQLEVLSAKIGYVVPLYLVITKCDTLVGFQESMAIAPVEKRQQMMGWSASYSLGEEFEPAWIDGGFDDMSSRIMNNQMEYLLVTPPSQHAENLVLFPDALSNLAAPLKVFLTELFRKSSMQRSFFFRGFYCTGVIPLEADSMPKLHAKEPPKNVSSLKDLIFQKIFQEFKLALPSQRRLFSISRSINFARIMLIIMALGWGWGMWYDYTDLQKKLGGLDTHFAQLNAMIQEHKSTPFRVYKESGVPTISQQAMVTGLDSLQKTYATISAINNGITFKSVFVPTSWSGQYDQRFLQSLAVAVNRLILVPFYHFFLYKLSIYSSVPIVDLNEYTNESVLFDPLQTPQYLLLEGFVVMGKFNEEAVGLFENLTIEPRIHNLNTLSQFLVNVPLPKEFLNNQKTYEKILKLAHKKMDVPVQDYAQNVGQRLEWLFKEFYRALFLKNASLTLIDTMAIHGNVQGGNLIQLQGLKEFMQQLGYLYRYIMLPSFSWIQQSEFNPGPSFSRIISLIDTLKIFSGERNAGDRFSQQGTALLKNMQDQLSNVASDTTGPFFQIDNGMLQAAPSEGFVNLLVNLHVFLNQDFMANIAAPQEIATAIPAGKILMWNPALLSEITPWIQTYESFLSTGVTNYPKAFQEHIVLLGRQYLSDHITTTFARAQNFTDVPATFTSYTLEDSVRTQVENFKSVLPVVGTTLATLKSSEVMSTYLMVRNLFVGQAYSLLQSIDTFFNSDAFYLPVAGNFDWWMGQPNSAYQAYNVSSIFGLQTYLANQRQRIIFIATELAAPLIQFLSQPYLQLSVVQSGLLGKWTTILDQVQAYNTKKPGNSLDALETYILNDMNTLSAENCQEKLKNVASVDPYTLDWFGQQLHNIQVDLAAQCQNMTLQQGTLAYSQLQKLFNAQLAGKYPFVGGNLRNIQGDAAPDDLRTFFTLFDQQLPLVQQYLRTLPNNQRNRSNRAMVERFMDQMASVRSFMSSFLSNKNPLAMPLYQASVTFRTNPKFELGANQVLSWGLNVGTTGVTNAGPAPATITWSYGEPVSLAFQWVRGGPLAPVVNPSDPNMSVDGTTVMLSINGPWSLLRLLDSYKAPATMLNPYRNRFIQSIMAAFSTQSTQLNGQAQVIPARLFVDIGLSQVDSTGQATPVEVPYFPLVAPPLD